MTLLSRKIDYALLILCYLHHKNGGASAREIAEHFRLSRPFVANILKDLCYKAFVASHRGIRGGYVLQPATPQATLADLLDSLGEDRFRLAECNQERPEMCCTLAEGCPVRGPIEAVHLRLRAVLESVRLAELFRHPESVEIGLVRCHS